MEIKIDKTIPIPSDVGAGRKAIYPFELMEVGDSFLVPAELRETAKSSAYSWASRKGVKFAVRTSRDGVRVWRTA